MGFWGFGVLHATNVLEEDFSLGKPHAPGDLTACDPDGIPAFFQENQLQEAATCFAGKAILAQLFHKGNKGTIGIPSDSEVQIPRPFRFLFARHGLAAQQE